jgi:hypothetical protein
MPLSAGVGEEAAALLEVAVGLDLHQHMQTPEGSPCSPNATAVAPRRPLVVDLLPLLVNQVDGTRSPEQDNGGHPREEEEGL